MIIKEINGNKLLIVNSIVQNIRENSPDFFINIREKLCSDNLDTAIIYYQQSDKILIDIFEKDGSFSNMCGNGVIALASYLSTNEMNRTIMMINNIGIGVETILNNNMIKFSLPVINIFKNCFTAAGEPHMIYFFDNYDENYHKKIGTKNTPTYNTTFISIKKNKYQFATYERGVNDITLACGTGAFCSIYYLVKILNINIDTIYSFSGKLYKFNWNKDRLFLEYEGN